MYSQIIYDIRGPNGRSFGPLVSYQLYAWILLKIIWEYITPKGFSGGHLGPVGMEYGQLLTTNS